MYKTISTISLCIGLAASQVHAQQAVPSDKPVFAVDTANPTADKPQSKLWFQDACWWALLPKHNGPSLWQRTDKGWVEHPEINQLLKGLPGRADVWADKDGATAVGVSQDSLVVFRLTPAGKNKPWKATVMATLKTPAKEDIETATITRDATGAWWIAADGTTSIYTWHAADGRSWSPAIPLQKGVSKDDICLITTVPGAVMVTWSNQREEAVQYRLHRDGHAPTDWEETGIVAAGHKTADDHLHATLNNDGSLWMVSKNSVDSLGYAQLVLRVRSRDGQWRNLPYAPRTNKAEPSRPVIITLPQGGMLEGHTIYDKTGRDKDRIEFAQVDTTAATILVKQQVVIAPALSLHAKVNNCTVPKAPLPANAPWIILASDERGNVYEADLRAYFLPFGK